MKRFAKGETGNPYRFDSNETGGINFFAFNAKKYLIFDSGCPIFFLVGRERLIVLLHRVHTKHAII